MKLILKSNKPNKSKIKNFDLLEIQFIVKGTKIKIWPIWEEISCHYNKKSKAKNNEDIRNRLCKWPNKREICFIKNYK